MANRRLYLLHAFSFMIVLIANRPPRSVNRLLLTRAPLANSDLLLHGLRTRATLAAAEPLLSCYCTRL